MVILEDIGCLDGIYINGDIIGSFWFVGDIIGSFWLVDGFLNGDFGFLVHIYIKGRGDL